MRINKLRPTSATLVAATLVSSLICTSVWAGILTTNIALESADLGFATQHGGTTGGLKATSNNIFTVSNVEEFIDALKANKKQPRIIQVKGMIDISDGKAYTSFNDQKKRSQLAIPSETTIIGISSDAGFKNGSLVIKHVDNVIVRNLYIELPVDVAPHFEKGDGWNAEWDGVNIIDSRNIWIDHMTFDDGTFTDDQYTSKDGWKYVQHDGELDIKHGSDFITVSYSVFKNHDKTMLIGHSKSNSKEDRGHLRVTLTNNIFSHVEQRTPRVRYGKIHSYNNVFESDYTADVYAYKASYGLGYEGSIISENNQFNIDNLDASQHCHIVDVKQPNSTLSDSGSTVSGQALDLSGCSEIPTEAVSWDVPYNYSLRSTASLASYLNKNAGAGHLSLK